MGRGVRSGDVVVSVTEIATLFTGKPNLTEAQVRDLLTQLVMGRAEEVRPGDLIKADLINAILARLDFLASRVALLEAAKPAGVTGVVIREPSSSTILEIGNRLIIKGDNLLPESVVMIDQTKVSGLKGSATNATLVLDRIPPINIGQGRMVELRVSNTAGADVAQFRLNPPTLTMPIGDFLVGATGGPVPDPGAAGYQKKGHYSFTFTITSGVQPDEYFKLLPQVDAGWQAVATPQEILIEAATAQPTVKTVSVAVDIPDSASPGETGNLTLLVQSKRDSTLARRSQPVKIKVNASAEPPRNMTPELGSTSGGAAAMRKNADGKMTGLIIPDGPDSQLILKTNVPADGDYRIDTNKLSKFLDDTSGKWSASVTQNGIVKLRAPTDTISVTVTAKQGAQNAKMVVDIVSVTDAKNSGYLELEVEPWDGT